MNRRWICSDVWMDILPSFDHAQLGLQMALLSDRFDVLVDAHFDGKRELKLWRQITICKDEEGPKPKLSVRIDDKFVDFPLPCRPLPNKIRFSCLRIDYIDHSVLTFLRSNMHIWDRNGIFLDLRTVLKSETDVDVFVRQIWPIFATNIHHLSFAGGHDHLDNLLRHISPSILTDCTRLHSLFSDHLCPDVIAADHDQFGDGQPNAATCTSAGQVLSKWLHLPRSNGKSNFLLCYGHDGSAIVEWINNFKEIFLRATTTTSVSYTIRFEVFWPTTQIVPFELENERTNEKLTLMKGGEMSWLLKRCPIIIGETAAVKWENDRNLNFVLLNLFAGKNCIGPLSPPPAEEADESNENDV